MIAGFWSRAAQAVLAVLGAVISVAAWSAGDSVQREREREIFLAGWAAAGQGDQSGIVEAIGRLDDYPLTPYLQFELFRQRIDQLSETMVARFLARYRHWSFASRLQTAWLRSLGERGAYDTLLRYADGVSDTRVRCHRARALLAAGRLDGLEQEVAGLWTVGRSQPDACDAVFAWWRRQGNPAPETAWRRFLLAVEAGENQLAGYLKRYLSPAERPWADHWLAMYSRPDATLRQARRWRDHDRSRALVAWGIKRLAREDWARAEARWHSLRDRFGLDPARRERIEREIALFRAVALDAGAIDAIDALPETMRDAQMMAWRARAALDQGDWPDVLSSIQAMPLRDQARSRWRYWRGRALAEMSRPEALVAFASLAAESSYYGFLAAARLGQPLNLCEQDVAADAAIQRRLMRDAEFERALELFHVGLINHARQTWARVARRLVAAELEQAALLAAGHGWHDLAIRAFNDAGTTRAYPWRFPLAEKGRVLEAARRWGIDPALAYGLMRAESAMQPDARSPAGAIGLMQLMPSTARAVAARNGLSYTGPSALRNPAVNVALGVAHLAELERRFSGDWVAVAAAYNAGIGAATRWLDERPNGQADVWIETLPYHETRDYVPRVLAFATIYEWQLQRPPRLLAAQIAPQAGAAAFACAP